MTGLGEKMRALFESGGSWLLLALFLVCLSMCALIAERGYCLEGTPWQALFGLFRKKRTEARARVQRALVSYLKAPTPERQGALLKECESYHTPYTRFLRRVFRHGEPESSDLREVRLAEAALLGELEVKRGLSLIKTLTRAALLLGLLGAVRGMIETTSSMSTSSTADPRAWATGVPIALIAAQVGLAAALPGVVGSWWLSLRARSLREEIRLARWHLGEGAAGAREGSGL